MTKILDTRQPAVMRAGRLLPKLPTMHRAGAVVGVQAVEGAHKPGLTGLGVSVFTILPTLANDGFFTGTLTCQGDYADCETWQGQPRGAGCPKAGLHSDLSSGQRICKQT
jgi:hypothetical protein